MKLLHDYTDEELLQSLVIEVLEHRLVDNQKVPTYTVEEEKFCCRLENKLYISRSYPLSESTTKHLGGDLKFGYMMDTAIPKIDLLFTLLNRFMDWTLRKWNVNKTLNLGR